MDLRRLIRPVPDFPRKGIVFRDITMLLKSPAALRQAVGQLAARSRGRRVDLVAGIEARGFLFGVPLSLELGAGFVPVRKPGRLPAKVLRSRYALEYGTGVLEMHRDAVRRGQRVLVVDDLLATGGTAAAAAGLIRRLGGNVVGAAFLIELAALHGRDRLAGMEIVSLITYG